MAPSSLEINPHRDHAAGPLAVLYSVQPDEDPLLHTGTPGSPNKTVNSSPFNDNVAIHSIESPRPVSALAGLECASPNRSLLSAFQAVSPRSQAIASRSTSAPSLSNLASPRGVLPQNSPLGPASPITTSPRQSSYHKSTYATAAFRALNGASPQKQILSRSSSNGSTSHSPSLPVTANVSPVRSRSSSALRQVQNDAPSKPSSRRCRPVTSTPADSTFSTAWTIFRDEEAPSSIASASTNAIVQRSDVMQNDSEEGVFALDEDIGVENDENSASIPQSEARVSSGNASSSTQAGIATEEARSSSAHTHHRSSLSTNSILLDTARERDVTPPPSASRWREATQNTHASEGEYIPSFISASAQRARKRIRTSGDLPA